MFILSQQCTLSKISQTFLWVTEWCVCLCSMYCLVIIALYLKGRSTAKPVRRNNRNTALLRRPRNISSCCAGRRSTPAADDQITHDKLFEGRRLENLMNSTRTVTTLNCGQTYLYNKYIYRERDRERERDNYFTQIGRNCIEITLIFNWLTTMTSCCLGVARWFSHVHAHLVKQ